MSCLIAAYDVGLDLIAPVDLVRSELSSGTLCLILGTAASFVVVIGPIFLTRQATFAVMMTIDFVSEPIVDLDLYTIVLRRARPPYRNCQDFPCLVHMAAPRSTADDTVDERWAAQLEFHCGKNQSHIDLLDLAAELGVVVIVEMVVVASHGGYETPWGVEEVLHPAVLREGVSAGGLQKQDL